jgi:hypothetical protein
MSFQLDYCESDSGKKNPLAPTTQLSSRPEDLFRISDSSTLASELREQSSLSSLNSVNEFRKIIDSFNSSGSGKLPELVFFDRAASGEKAKDRPTEQADRRASTSNDKDESDRDTRDLERSLKSIEKQLAALRAAVRSYDSSPSVHYSAPAGTLFTDNMLFQSEYKDKEDQRKEEEKKQKDLEVVQKSMQEEHSAFADNFDATVPDYTDPSRPAETIVRTTNIDTLTQQDTEKLEKALPQLGTDGDSLRAMYKALALLDQARTRPSGTEKRLSQPPEQTAAA